MVDVLERFCVALNGPLGPVLVDRLNAMLADTQLSVALRTPVNTDDVDDEARLAAVKRALHALDPEQCAEIAVRLEAIQAATKAADATLSWC
jgi:hypothetical protein